MILYGGTAYSFAQDPDFTSVSKKVQYWEDVIEKYYSKYKGLDKWHKQLIKSATTTNYVSTPLGRVFRFDMTKNKRGEMVWPVTDIKNYPVQGTGADIVCMSRVMVAKRFTGLRSKLIATVHDSIVADCPEDEVDTVCKIFTEEIAKTPKYLSQYFGVDFNLPLVGELEIGQNMADTEKVKL